MGPDDIADQPTKLPKSGWHKRTVAENADLKRHIGHLVAVGCDRQVVYWCLWNMSRATQELRMGAVQKPVFRQGEEEFDMETVRQLLATGDDMAELTTKVQAAADSICRFEKELLIAANVLLDDPEVPRDMMESEKVTPNEAMTLLRSLLHLRQANLDACAGETGAGTRFGLHRLEHRSVRDRRCPVR